MIAEYSRLTPTRIASHFAQMLVLLCLANHMTHHPIGRTVPDHELFREESCQARRIPAETPRLLISSAVNSLIP